MKAWSLIGWALVLGLFCVATNAWSADAGTLTPVATGNTLTPAPGVEPVGVGTTLTALNETYEENTWLEDFQVHFIVSLPFTALYSYAAVTTLDGLVQGHYPTTFRQADLWVVVGVAVGSSLAVALGSIGRVPDQSVPRISENETPAVLAEDAPSWRLALIQVDY